MPARSNWGGRNGQPIQVETNSFEIVSLPNKPYYQYQLIEPEVKPVGRRTEIVERMQLTYAADFTPRPVFDGQHLLYSSRQLPTVSYRVSMSDRPAAPGRPQRGLYEIKLNPASVINTTDVQQLISRGVDDPSTKTATNLLQMLVRQAPSMKYVRKGRSYFTDVGRLNLDAGGIEIWQGFFQSVRPSIGRMLVNIDISITAMYSRGPLINYAMNLLNVRDASSLQVTRQRPEFLVLKKALTGVFVIIETNKGPDETKRRRKIRNIVEEAGMFKFDRTDSVGNTTNMTVAEYFQNVYRRPIRYPRIFGVDFGTPDNPNVIPAELCSIPPGQIYKKKLSEQMMDKARSFATKKPQERIGIIKNGVSRGSQNILPPTLEYRDSDFLKNAGMSVAPAPLTIQGRVLQAPGIRFASGPPVMPRSGAWQTLQNRLQKTVPVESWFVINLSHAIRDEEALEMVNVLVQSCKRLGIPIEVPPAENYIRHAQAEAALGQIQAIARKPPSLVLVFLPERAPDFRAQVKNWGDLRFGVMTQCLRESKVRKALGDWRNRNTDQYTNNVALKINAKLGGINSDAHSQLFAELAAQPFMICGADVSHPGVGVVNRPSVTSLVWSHDRFATQYASYSRVQAPRQEIIADLREMMKDALIEFGKKNRVLPSRIFFYRDGVSEGEYRKVSDTEINDIEEAITQIQQEEPAARQAPRPVITFMVVGKRHHVRFFPKSERDQDRSGNCPAGFVADKGLTSPIIEDFYLQSHAGLLGTSRPSHYIVLKDDNFGYNADKLQELCWVLCHVYAKANRSVSIPAPVYYADIICSRAEFYFDSRLRFTEETTSSGGSSQFNLEMWKSGFGDNGKGPVKACKMMYFC